MKVDADEPTEDKPQSSQSEQPSNQEQDSNNTVTLDDDEQKPEDGEVQVTDGDGNVIKESENGKIS